MVLVLVAVGPASVLEVVVVKFTGADKFASFGFSGTSSGSGSGSDVVGAGAGGAGGSGGVPGQAVIVTST